jgi:hypothetical protein
MAWSREQAGEELAAIDDIVRRVKQSRIYRVSGEIAMMWGVLQFLQYGVYALAPKHYGGTWIAVDAIGIALTALMLRRVGFANAAGPGRALAAFAVFYGFGFVWTGLIGQFGPREMSVFWHTLFLFGYSVAGLWFGGGFLAIGLGLTAAIVAVYYLAGAAFWPAIAVVSGAGYILCGYWMRRA